MRMPGRSALSTEATGRRAVCRQAGLHNNAPLMFTRCAHRCRALCVCRQWRACLDWGALPLPGLELGELPPTAAEVLISRAPAVVRLVVRAECSFQDHLCPIFTLCLRQAQASASTCAAPPAGGALRPVRCGQAEWRRTECAARGRRRSITKPLPSAPCPLAPCAGPGVQAAAPPQPGAARPALGGAPAAQPPGLGLGPGSVG